MDNLKKTIDTAIVSFIDVLGYGDVVRRHINDVNLIHNIEGIAKTALSLLFKCAELKDLDYQEYMQKIVKTINIKMVSDSILFILNLSKIESDFRVNKQENLTCHVWTYFTGISAFCLTFIPKIGLIVRGGMSIGPHYETDEENILFIFSQAYINAVKLEKSQANKPRIAVDDVLYGYLENISFRYIDKMFYEDEDGVKCFDLYCFSKFYQPHKRIFHDMKQSITANIKFNLNKPEPDKNILEKLKYFTNFHNKKMTEGGESFKDYCIDVSLFDKKQDQNYF